jgi:hypothetical protein
MCSWRRVEWWSFTKGLGQCGGSPCQLEKFSNSTEWCECLHHHGGRRSSGVWDRCGSVSIRCGSRNHVMVAKVGQGGAVQIGCRAWVRGPDQPTTVASKEEWAPPRVPHNWSDLVHDSARAAAAAGQLKSCTREKMVILTKDGPRAAGAEEALCLYNVVNLLECVVFLCTVWQLLVLNCNLLLRKLPWFGVNFGPRVQPISASLSCVRRRRGGETKSEAPHWHRLGRNFLHLGLIAGIIILRAADTDLDRTPISSSVQPTVHRSVGGRDIKGGCCQGGYMCETDWPCLLELPYPRQRCDRGHTLWHHLAYEPGSPARQGACHA